MPIRVYIWSQQKEYRLTLHPLVEISATIDIPSRDPIIYPLEGDLQQSNLAL